MCTKSGASSFLPPSSKQSEPWPSGESFMERPSKPGNELEGLIHDKLPVLLGGT